MNWKYPWSGVVGQEPLKLALLLSAIDPSIGGVLVRGPRGVAKTTLARALAELVPGRFVELPLGATEERVTGTLDLGSALRDGKVEFAPGLLSRAHEGVLYVDEVNLLPDALVDLLLDAAASGVNVVERDGVSHRHAARFVLIGTMNPDEGGLRPQLVDRFGLAASAAADIKPEERAAIVARRLAFEHDPEAFVARYAQAQRALVERCSAARARTAAIPLEGHALARVAERCYAAGVEGVRADLAMLRAARAHAAWHARTDILEEDIEAVAELALSHRRPAHREPPNGGGSATGGQRTGGASSGGSATGSTAANAAGKSAGAGDRGALPPVPVRALEGIDAARWLGAHRKDVARAVLASAPRHRARARRGAGAARSRSIDWFATLARTRQPRPHDLRYRRLPILRPLLVLALDCSSSMLQGQALAAAKTIATALLTENAANAELALIAFSGVHAGAECTVHARGQTVARAISELGAGGGTPLRRALLDALGLARRAEHRGVRDKRLVLLTDGRTREPITDLRTVREEFAVTVIDCERARVRIGRARGLARELEARYMHVDTLLSVGLL